MSFNSIKRKMQGDRGFTIVELLIVIVVIGILAAITIVSFNGVTARANTANAQSAAEAAIKKSEAYNAENSGYPTSGYQLVNGASTTTYQLTGVTFTTTQSTGSTAASPASQLNFFTCGGTGVQVSYFNFSNNTWVNQVTGSCPSPVYKAGTATT